MLPQFVQDVQDRWNRRVEELKDLVADPHEENAPRCHRCGGSGYIEQFSHIQGGRCFRCNGSGYEPKAKVEWAVRTDEAVVVVENWDEAKAVAKIARDYGHNPVVTRI